MCILCRATGRTEELPFVAGFRRREGGRGMALRLFLLDALDLEVLGLDQGDRPLGVLFLREAELVELGAVQTGEARFELVALRRGELADVRLQYS